MADATSDRPNTPPLARFPFVTVGAAAGVLFAFLFLTWFVRNHESVLDTPKPDAKPDAAAKLDEVKARNEAALAGVGAKMSRDEARGKLLGTLKGPKDTLPFPTPEPVVPAAPKKDEKAEEKKP